MKKIIHIAIVVFLYVYIAFSVVSLLTINPENTFSFLTDYFGRENQKNIKAFIGQYHQLRTKGVKEYLHPDLVMQLQSIEKHPAMRYFFSHEPEAVRSISYQSETIGGDSAENGTHRTYVLQYDFSAPDFVVFPVLDQDLTSDDKFNSLIITINEIEKAGKTQIVGFHIAPLKAQEKQVGKFSFKEKTPFAIGFFVAAVLLPIFVLFALTQFVRMPEPIQKTKWLFFIAFGLMEWTLNWATGEITTNLLSIHLLSAGFSKMGYYAPWMITLALPLGAVLFLLRKRKWMADYQLGLLAPTESEAD